MTKSKAPRGIRPIVYPPGVKDVTQDLSKDELIRRLKMLARAFQDMEQEEEISQYEPLALFLVSSFFVKHSSKDVRLLVACCVADIFRIFAPEAPFRTEEQLKMIFQFINKQLWGLENVEGPSWKRYFYLLENLAMVKSYNICMELEDANEIFVELFTIFFSIISENHSPKVRTFMLDVMCPLISENDAVPADLLEIILSNLLDSKKLDNPLAFQLAKELIRRTATTIEPSIQTFFNNILILGRISESDASSHAYELIYQLNTISSSLLLSVLPQLEFKLKSNDEKERLQVTKLLGRMFSDKDSDLISQNKPLWNCYLGRFSDICTEIRVVCVKFVSQFLIYHSWINADLTERLRERAHDTDEGVRQEVVVAIITAAKRDINKITDDMLTIIKERTLDKKWKIRKEAVLGLGHIYKKWYHNAETPRADYERLKWVKNKLLHMYYQTNIEDRLLVERIFTMTLVPYTMDVKDRMKRLMQLFATVDQHAVKAIMELMRCQHLVRSHVRDLMALYHKDKAQDKKRLLLSKLVTLSKYLPDPSKAQDHLKKLSEVLNEDMRIRGYMKHVVDPAVTCKKATQAVSEVMKKFGNPKNPSPIYVTIKTLMERIAPLMIDAAAVKELIGLVAEHVEGEGQEYDEDADESPTVRGLKLLQSLSVVFPDAYKTSEARELLLTMLKNEDEDVSDIALQVFIATGHGLEADQPHIASSLLPMLMSKARTGSRIQAKNAVYCVGVVATNKHAVYKMIFESAQKCLTLEHENFVTSLTSLGYIAKLAPKYFAIPMKSVIASSVVKGLLMQDATDRSHIRGIWCHDDLVCNETRAKECAIKTIIHWLQGLRSNQNGSATSTLRLLGTYLKNEGDLMEKSKASKAEMSRLRLAAGCAILKLAQEHCYAELISLELFQLLALLINDECYQVREQFSKKLNKGLISLRLPLNYMAIFSLCAKDPVKESRTTAKQFIQRNIQARRDYLKTRTVESSQLLSLLPENVIPYAIHLLAHDPDFTSLRDIEALNDIKECLWFLLEPLVNRNENCSFIRKLVETIKRTKDAQNQDDKSSHKRLYAVCDIVLGLLLTRTPTYTLKEHPGDVLLPVKLFIKPKKAINSHMDSFLPKKLQEEFSKVPGVEKKNLTNKLLETPPPKGKGAKQGTSSNNKNKTDTETTQNVSATSSKKPAAAKGGKKNQKAQKSDENTPKSTPVKATRRSSTVTSPPTEISNATNTQNDKKVLTRRNRRGALAEKKITNNEQDSSQSSLTSENNSSKSLRGKRKLRTSKKHSSSQSSQDSDETPKESTVKKRKLNNKKRNDSKSRQTSDSDSPSSPALKHDKPQTSIKRFLTRNKVAESPSSPSSAQSSPAKRPQKRGASENSITKPAKKVKTKASVETKCKEQKRGETRSARSPRKHTSENVTTVKASPRPSSSDSSQQSSGSQAVKRLHNWPSTKLMRFGTRSSSKSTRSGRTRMDSPLSSPMSSPVVPSPKKLSSKSAENRTLLSKKKTSSLKNSGRKLTPPFQKIACLKKVALSPKKVALSPKKVALSPKKVVLSPKRVTLTPTKINSSIKKVAASPKKVISSPSEQNLSPRKFASKTVRGPSAKSSSKEVPKKIVSPIRTLVQKKLSSFIRKDTGDDNKMTSTPKVSSYSTAKKPLLTGKKAPSPVKKGPMRVGVKRNLSKDDSQNSSSSSSSINSSPRKLIPRKGVKIVTSPVKRQTGKPRTNVRNVRKAPSRQIVNGLGNSDGESTQSTSDEDTPATRSKRTRTMAKIVEKASPKKKVAAGTGINISRKSRRRKP